VTLGLENALAPEEHSLCRPCVGQLQFLAPTRPDAVYATQELARGLQPRACQSWNKHRRLGRGVRLTEIHVLIIRPRLQLAGQPPPLELDTYAGTDWARCMETREPRAGCGVFRRECCACFFSKKQGLRALSGGEAPNIMSCGYDVMATIFLRSFLREVSLAPQGPFQLLHRPYNWRADGDSVRSVEENSPYRPSAYSTRRAWLHTDFRSFRRLAQRTWPTWPL
jgi:hypothetical protein